MGRVIGTFVPIESPRFVTAGLSIDDRPEGIATSLDCDEDVSGAIVRLRYTATREQQRQIDVAALRASLFEAGARVVKIVPDIVREDRARVEGVDETLDELAALDLYIDANQVEAALAGRMRERTRDYIEAAT